MNPNIELPYVSKRIETTTQMPEMSDPICVISNNQKTETVASRDSGIDTQKMHTVEY